MIQTPDWVKHAIFYQIFPDRFARERHAPRKSTVRFKPWGSPPEEQGFQGGDLYGVVEKLDYLQQLGITALYLNPIFASAANHRYHTFDFFQVDPLLGGEAALRLLLDEAHQRGMRVVLDGVFNHASRGFWQFHHILENGADSPYIDWFVVEDWPLRPYHSTPEHPANYAAWWGLPALPKLNTKNPDVQDYIYEIARHWIDFGIDGWRLDVPQEIDDASFWRRFRNVVKQANPEAYICGEIWEEAQAWLEGDQFDSVMNYIFSWVVMSYVGAKTLRTDYIREHLSLEPRDAGDFAEVINYMHGLYDWEINHVQLNLLDSHDTARALWILGEDKSALKLAALLQMTMPGAPCIYYGDEIGMSAADDPHCREAFPWHKPESWDEDLLQYYKSVTALRHEFEALRTGSFKPLYARGEIYSFRRLLGLEELVVVVNTGAVEAHVELPVNGIGNHEYQEVWPTSAGLTYFPHGVHLQLNIPPRSALVVKALDAKS